MFYSRSVTAFLFAIVIAIFIGCSSETTSFKFTPSKLDFEEVYLGDSREVDVVMKNKYGKLVSISKIEFQGTTDYEITNGGVMPIQLDKNQEHTFTIKFDPTSNGEINGMMVITHDASTKPYEYKLLGVGVAVPRITLSEQQLDFQYRLTNTTVDLSVDISNTGTADMTISGLSFVGVGSTAYSITAGGTTPQIIKPNQLHTVTVQFAPTTTGQFLCDLEIIHDGVNESSPLNLPILGEAFNVAPKIDVDRIGPWDFGTVAKTIPTVNPIEISSVGLSDLTITSIDFTYGAEFSLDHVEDENGNTVALPQTVVIGKKIVAFIKFTPTANSNFNDTISITHDGVFNSSPYDVSVTGTGRDEVTKTFTFTGSAEQWTVPQDIKTIVIECYGAEGGSNYSRVPGKGGLGKATRSVTPGDVLNIYVGGQGSGTGGGTGGWNGGANGGGYANYTAGGGGGSDVRIGGTDWADRIVVGGGGGGAAWDTQAGRPIGGDGGGLTGGDGTAGYNAGPGLGGTQTAGGAGGRTAASGTFGEGGMGVGTSLGGAGGGGGWYGGGGGYCSGGGGGSSYYDAPGNTDKSTQKGIHSGDGQVIIRY